MSIYKRAQQLASMGFYVFPLQENGKTPALKDFTDISTCNPKDLARFWYDSVLELEHYFNIGIATSKYDLGWALLVVDVDNKNGKNGSETLLKLELEGFEFPKTMTQKTPTGGFHIIYKVKVPVKQGVDVLGVGLDIRSRGGYIVGAGSIINDKEYTIDKTPIARAPKWLIDKCEEKKSKERKAKNAPTKKVSQKGAKLRAKDYLLNQAPVAVEGSGGDQTTFRVATKLKDLGLTEENCLEAMLDHWNDNCQPPWRADDLQTKIENAYVYGQNKIGIDSPENDFSPVKSSDDETLGPIEKLNKEYAFIVLGGKSKILRVDARGKIDYRTVQAFHDYLKADTISTGNGKKKQLSQLWFCSPKRPSFHGAEMHPEQKAPFGIYNLWRGFTCKPLGADETPTKDMIEGVRLFKDHALKNVCLGDEKLFHWLMGYFAHMIQRPWEKPLTALVFKGKKGVGKNALIDRLGNLFKPHYETFSNKRFFTSNFNAHLEQLLLMVLDEISWGGDKQAEGILKDLITGNTHVIERKGCEVFSVENLLRVCLIGNEEWIIPASEDERRFAVFNIGDARENDRPYFTNMRKLIDDKGGNRLLLKELLAFDLSTIEVNRAPNTIGLFDQKIESLDIVHSWWYSCLMEGLIFGLEFKNDWPNVIGRNQLREAFQIYSKERGIRSWFPSASAFGREFRKCLPNLKSKRSRSGEERIWSYTLPNIHECRKQFESYIRYEITWEDENENENEALSIFDAVDPFS